MRTLITMTVLVLSLAWSHAGNTATVTDEKTKAEMMQKMMAAGTPGASHKVLADMAGEYTFTGKSWESANAKPFESKGTASMKMLLGGRWLQNTITAEASGEMPAFEGIGLTGYNNVKKEYQTIWMDSMSTGAMVGSGQFDAKSKTLKDSGKYTCPMTDTERDYRAQWQIKNKNTLVYSMHGTSPMDPKGKEFKMMEMTFKRK